MAEAAVGHIILLSQDVWLGKNRRGYYLEGLTPNHQVDCSVAEGMITFVLGGKKFEKPLEYKQDQNKESSA